MNTPAATSTTTAPAAKAAASAPSLARSAKFKTFAIAFSTFGAPVYVATQFFNWPLFTFHPATNRLVWGYEGPRPGEGPNMLWYGWTGTTIIVAAIIGLIAMMLPQKVTRRIPLAPMWLLPILAVPYIWYSLLPWWTHR
jgi:hypothetical protein